MNQILITNNIAKKQNSKNTNGQLEIKSVARFFAIIIMIFGIILAGNGAYALMQDIQETQNASIPVVTTTRRGSQVQVDIQNTDGIRTISYYWNSSTQVNQVAGQNKNEASLTITIPTGNSKLNLSIIDRNGKQTNYVKNYYQEGDDTTEPIIEFEVVNQNIKIIATDDREMDYIVYKIGDEQEQIKEVEEEDPTTIEVTIPVPQRQVTITVEAVDKAQNVVKKEQEIKGATEPKIEVIPDPNDPSYLIIKATDEEGLRMVAYYVNGAPYQTDPNTSLNTTTFEWKQKVEPGENRITVHAYNINEQMAEFVGIYNY